MLPSLKEVQNLIQEHDAAESDEDQECMMKLETMIDKSIRSDPSNEMTIKIYSAYFEDKYQSHRIMKRICNDLNRAGFDSSYVSEFSESPVLSNYGWTGVTLTIKVPKK